MNTQLVEAGYDALADQWQDEREGFDNRRELVEFARLLAPKAKVLDAGSGTGVPVDKFLVGEGFRVLGIDLSSRMIELAKQNVPQAEYQKGDMLHANFPDNSFDGIISLHAIIHLPREKHGELFRSFHRMLKHQGPLVVSMLAHDFEGVKEHHGQPMFLSHYAAEQTLEVIKRAGFSVVSDYHVETPGVTHYWIIARAWK